MTMKRFLILLLLGTFHSSLVAQFTDSNLPIVIIETDNGLEIPDQPRITASMKIIYRGPGERNYVSDGGDESRLDYNGKIRIETRGSSSQSLVKKQYGLTTVLTDNVTNNNVGLLGMPPENDWVLNGLAYDASLIRDFLSFNLSALLGNYAPRQRYCEVVINNDYRGLYVLTEKVKVDDNRVDVVKIDVDDNTLPDLSGGYLIKADKVTWEDPSAWTMLTYLGTQTDFIHERPDPTTITPAQHDYIMSVFNRLSSVATNPSITKGFPAVIDVPSFVDFMLVNELAANVDAYQFSTFFHKDKNGKLRAGPLWDLNLTYGNDLWFWGLDRSKTNTWQFSNDDNVGPRFWLDLYNTGTFRCYLARRWHELIAPGAPLNLNSLNAFIDETVDLISEATVRENARWQSVGNHAVEINKIKDFLATRITWMSGQLTSFNSCADVPTPPLVITRINYQPSVSTQFSREEDQEFIEIINNGTTAVPLTGIYFRGTGFVYQFPDGATLPGNAVIQLGNNRNVFQARYGYEPYGQFTRNLSNAGHTLTLADAFGNIIDEVSYSDNEPWPEADGTGAYLKLKNVNLDNNKAESWEATNEAIFTTEDGVVGFEEKLFGLEIYPNPAEGILIVKTQTNLEQVVISDIHGRNLIVSAAQHPEVKIDVSQLAPGLYFFRIKSGQNHTVGKFIKK